MRVHRFALVMTVLSAPLLLAAGCFDAAGNCDINWNLQDCEGAGGAGAGAGGTGSGSTTNTVTTGVTPGCDPLALEGQALPTTCGLFVNPTVGEGVGDGTQMNPYGSIAEALLDDPGAAIYVCSTEGELDEAVILVGTEQLFGGLRCDDWRASGSRTGWTAQPGDIPLTLNGTPSAHVQGFAISSRAVTAHDPVTLQGDSSIAVLADNAVGSLVDLTITAGAGAEGGDGENVTPTQAPGRQSNASEFDGNNGMPCGNGAGAGVKTASLACPAGGLLSEGGAGGTGTTFMGGPGFQGATPPQAGEEPDGDGGQPDPSPGSGFSCGASMGHGEDGYPGAAGNEGPGGTSAGTISPDGYTGDGGDAGMNGARGQGGGGGSGRPGNVICSGTAGLGGGSGGVGGCGGLAGSGGGAGGASIGLVSIQSTLTFTNVTITAAAGGAGGLGGNSQTGGSGGLGGQGGNSHAQACDGGPGGDGGDGGPGGGGAGGPSLGIAFTGTMPDLPDGSITVASSGAPGGDGGNNNAEGNSGATGATAKRQQF